MPNLKPGTVVAEAKCSCCGKPVQVKLNKNGGAYYFCPWTDETGVQCSHHERWGRANSQKMQRNYLEARERSKSQPDEVTTHEPAKPEDGTDTGVSKPPKPDGGGSSIFDVFA